jgi:hypothetical protein
MLLVDINNLYALNYDHILNRASVLITADSMLRSNLKVENLFCAWSTKYPARPSHFAFCLLMIQTALHQYTLVLIHFGFNTLWF